MEKKISFSEILKKYTMVIVLVFVVIMFSVNTKGVMLLPQNVNNLVAQNAYVFILATGMLFCILTGGNIDLSVGSVVCFVAAVGGKMMVLNSMNPYLTMIVMLLVGIAIGAWQGFWIAYVRIPPFIVTLAGMLAFRGLSNVVLQGQTLAPMPDSYLALFNNYIPDPFGKEGFNVTCFVVGIIRLCTDMPLNLRAHFHRNPIHSRIRNNECIRSNLFQFGKVSPHTLKILVMCQNIRGDIDLYAMLMRKLHTFFHIFHRKVLRLRPKSEDFSADIYGICAEDHCYF